MSEVPRYHARLVAEQPARWRLAEWCERQNRRAMPNLMPILEFLLWVGMILYTVGIAVLLVWLAIWGP